MPLFLPVTGVQAASNRIANLLGSAVPQPEDENEHWQEGFAWRSELCPQFEVIDPCSTPTAYDTDDTGDGVIYHKPSGYRVRDYATTLNVAFDLARVRRQAEAVGSFAAASELWTGAATQADPYAVPPNTVVRNPSPSSGEYTNPYLAAPTSTTITAVTDPMEALGLLEERARQQIGGMQCFLHVPTRIATQLGAQIRRVGNLIYTQTDAIVVADPGYPGTGPDGTDPASPGTWCYATGPVILRMSDISVTEQPVSATINRRTNRREVWADRMFAATFDPCCHFAIEID
jgi:hypothetical protein